MALGRPREGKEKLFVMFGIAFRTDGIRDLRVIRIDKTEDLTRAHHFAAQMTREALLVVGFGRDVKEVAMDVLSALGADFHLRLTCETTWNAVVVHEWTSDRIAAFGTFETRLVPTSTH
jgi:hypothetical protein